MTDEPVRGFEPDYAVPPGATVLEGLAYKLGLEDVELLALFEGTYRIDEKLVEALCKEIGPSPQFWLNMEAHYQAALKRLAKEAANDELVPPG